MEKGHSWKASDVPQSSHCWGDGSTHQLCWEVTVLDLVIIGGKGDLNNGHGGYNQFTVYNKLLSSSNDFGSLLVFSCLWDSDLRDEVSSMFSNSFKTAISWKCLASNAVLLFVCLLYLVLLICLWPSSFLPCLRSAGLSFFMFSKHSDLGMTNIGNKWWINPPFHCTEPELWRAPGERWQPGQHSAALWGMGGT